MLKWGDLEKYKIFRVLVVLVVCVSLSVSVLAAPVQAAGNGFFVNAFDYGLPTLNSTVLEEGTYFTLNDNTKFNNVIFDIPRSYLSYVEVVFYSPVVPGSLILVNAVNGLGGPSFTLEDLGGGLYRGTITPNASFSDIELRFLMHSYPARVQIMSCRYSVEYSPVSTVGKISVYQAGTNVGSVTMASPSSPAVVQFGGNKTDIEQATWYTDCTVDDWKNYTHLSYIFSCLVLSVTSVYAFVGDQSVPCDVSYIDMPSEGTAGTDPSVVDNYRKRVQFSVTVDLSDVAMNTEETLIVYVSGTSSLNTTGNEVRLTSVLGYYDYEQTSGVVFFLQKIWNSIVSLGKDIQSYFTELVDRIEAIFNPEEASNDLQSAVDEHESQMDSIDQIEQGLITDFGEHKGAVTGAFNVGSFAAALTFCSSILQRTFNNLGDYQIVIILPIALGIVLFVCSRARGVDVARKNNVDTTAMSADASRRSPHADVAGDDFRESSFYDSDRDQSPL